MFRSRLTGRVVTACLLALVSVPPAAGQTWTGNTNQFWANGSNWSSSPLIPASSPDTRLIFGATAHATMSNVTPYPTFLLNRMTFTDAAPAYTLSGNPLEFQANGSGVAPLFVQNSTNAATINTDLVLTDRLTVGGTGTGAVAFNGVLSGAGGLHVSSAATLTLGNSANSFDGDVEVSLGTLSITSPTAVPQGADVTVRQGAVFRIGFTNTGNFQDPIGRLILDGGTFRGPAA